MAFTLNGFGTTYYGVRWLPDGTYITTKWVVFCFIPVARMAHAVSGANRVHPLA